jgi:hypothetical protein
MGRYIELAICEISIGFFHNCPLAHGYSGAFATEYTASVMPASRTALEITRAAPPEDDLLRTS